MKKPKNKNNIKQKPPPTTQMGIFLVKVGQLVGWLGGRGRFQTCLVRKCQAFLFYNKRATVNVNRENKDTIKRKIPPITQTGTFL